MAEADFKNLLKRVRRGDDRAAADLVGQFEPELRRIIRLRFTDPYLRRLVDSGDICQSVMANFFVRATLGQFDLEEPASLMKLLVTMARNKLFNIARDRRREKEATRGGLSDLIDQAADRDPSPSRVIEFRDLVQKARGLLRPRERLLAEKRLRGTSWQDIADEVGESPEKLRKQYTRALARVARQLGIEEGVADE